MGEGQREREEGEWWGVEGSGGEGVGEREKKEKRMEDEKVEIYFA